MAKGGKAWTPTKTARKMAALGRPWTRQGRINQKKVAQKSKTGSLAENSDIDCRMENVEAQDNTDQRTQMEELIKMLDGLSLA